MSASAYFGKRTFCVITGASRGIGQSIAAQLAGRVGADSLVVVAARSVDKLRHFADELAAANPAKHVRAERLDLQSAGEEDFARLLRTDTGEPFQVAIIVHNAASVGPVDTPLVAMKSLDLLQDYYRLNLTSMIALNGHFLDQYSRVPTKLVIQITSDGAVIPCPSMGLYCAGKAARDMYNRCLAAENAHIRVLSYGPGFVDTVMLNEVKDNSWNADVAGAIQGAYDEKEDKFTVLTPDETANFLMELLEKDTFENGAHIDHDSFLAEEFKGAIAKK